MRIVAGTLKGRTVEAPAGEGTRPTTDRVREALFSSLYSLRGGFEGARVLDAFAGSGALGIEALSRGSETCVFYEKDPKAASVLKKNLEACKLGAPKARLERRDVLQADLASFKEPFDIVLLDPPYDFDEREVLSLVSRLSDGGALPDGAIVVYEHAIKKARDVEQAVEEHGFELIAAKKYGKTGVTVFRAR